ncbi:Hydrogenase expression/formation protein HupG [uncultured Pleomorphomonas sp.]|uniref:Hydrogenase expression/formation protein n=1 Tax=uncultured Pleomorphomonas sp. TaxID=442121 RepID=A0A212LCZ0_9HYPH|nr:hydrogenase accessory protein [uncultured Pleomorphomonas sp.]SCM75219.1 Hydrogenase expression/formation protein HupG [uncultured Pleomorphomonas sp.]
MSALIAALTARHGLPVVDADSIDAFLAPAAGEPDHALLLFTGDPNQRADSGDVAVVLPELIAAFPGRFRAGVVARSAEAALKIRCRVEVFPSLVVLGGSIVLDVLPRIRDWSEYIDRLGAALRPDAPAFSAPSRVEVTTSARRADA